MGRDAGFLALNGAIASGAEAAIIPEISMEKDQLAEMIETGFRKSKNSSIVLVAESEVTGGAMGVAERVKKEYPQFDVRVRFGTLAARWFTDCTRPYLGNPDGSGCRRRVVG